MDEGERSLPIDAIPIPTWIYDRETLAFLDVNAVACNTYGYARDEFLAMTILDIRPTEDRPLLLRSVNEAGQRDTQVSDGPWRHLRRDGSLVSVEVSAASLDFAGRPGRVVMVTDVTPRVRAEERAAYLGTHDPLTGLPNRSWLLEHLQREVARADVGGSSIAVLVLDIDGFRRLNDTLGHGGGDEALCAVARRLESSVPEGAVVVREGSDSFIVVVPGVGSVGEIAKLARHLQLRLKAPLPINHQDVVVGVSVGISRYPEDALDAEALLRHADTALVRAKARGFGSVQEYMAQMHAQALRRLTLERDLRRAWDGDGLWLAFQPIIDIRSWHIVGAEALLRWRHPEYGEIPPADFIPIAEECGMIDQIGEWVVNEACAQAARWPPGAAPTRVTVNVSPLQFAQHELPSTIAGALERCGLAPERLELELTESSVMADTQASARIMHDLKAMRVRLSVDDFGTGYSSLGYLKHFPLDTIKIDRTFIREIDTDPFDEAIGKAIITLARSLDLRVVAEGVERHEHLDALRRIGCHESQGFFFCEGVPGEVFETLLARGFASPACHVS